MSEFVVIGHKITFPALRDYVLSHKIDSGDAIVLNAHDYENLVHEMKDSDEGTPGLPVNFMGVLLTQDATDTVPIGKLQVVKNDKPYL